MRVLPSTVTSRGSSAWPSGIDMVSWPSTLPSIPASAMPFFCSRWNGSTSSISSASDSGPCPRKATRPVRGSGSVMSTVKAPLRASLRPSGTLKEASGTVISKVWSSRRTSARGASSTGQLSTRASAMLAPSSVSEPCSGPVLPPSRPRCRSPRRAGTCRPGSSRARAACTTQSRVCGASGAGHSVLKMLAGIGPILPSRWAFMTPAMSVTSPSAETSAPPARSLNWLSTTRPRSGEKNPRADQSSRSRRGSSGGSAPIQPPADLRSKDQPGPSGPMRVHDVAGELHAAVAPDEHRGRDLEAARGAVVGQREMPAVDAQRRRRQPRQQHLARRRVDADRAAQDLAGAGQIELRIAPHRHIEALQRRQLRQRARQPARDQPLHGNGELQGLGALVLVGAEVERPGAGQRVDLGAAGDRAAAAAVVEIDVQLRHAPDALAAAVVDDHGGGPEPDLAQVGAGLLAPPCARGRIGEHLDEVDAPQRSVVVCARCRGRDAGISDVPRSAGDFARSFSGASAGLENLSESVPSSP